VSGAKEREASRYSQQASQRVITTGPRVCLEFSGDVHSIGSNLRCDGNPEKKGAAEQPLFTKSGS